MLNVKLSKCIEARLNGSGHAGVGTERVTLFRPVPDRPCRMSVDLKKGILWPHTNSSGFLYETLIIMLFYGDFTFFRMKV